MPPRKKQKKTPKKPKQYVVEDIVGYEIRVKDNNEENAGYDPTLPAEVEKLCYRVKWVGYDEEENTWEPKSSFSTWTKKNERQVQDIFRLVYNNDPAYDPEVLEAQVKKIHEELRKQKRIPKIGLYGANSSAVITATQLDSPEPESDFRNDKLDSESDDEPPRNNLASQLIEQENSSFMVNLQFSQQTINSNRLRSIQPTEIQSHDVPDAPVTPPEINVGNQSMHEVTVEFNGSTSTIPFTSPKSKSCLPTTRAGSNTRQIPSDVASFNLGNPSRSSRSPEPVSRGPATSSRASCSPVLAPQSKSANQHALPNPNSNPDSISKYYFSISDEVFNKGLVRPNTDSQGFLIIKSEALQRDYEKCDFLKDHRNPKPYNTSFPPFINSIRSAFGLTGNKPYDHFGFETLGGGTLKVAWIYAPKKDFKLSATGNNKKLSIWVNEQYHCLQALITHMGVKIQHKLDKNVDIVLIHHSEIENLWEEQIEGLKDIRVGPVDKTLFFVFGSEQGKPVMFKPFWAINAITFTPQALEEHDVSPLLQSAFKSKRLYPCRRDTFSWLPSSYFAKRGPLYVYPVEDPSANSNTKLAMIGRIYQALVFERTVNIGYIRQVESRSSDRYSFPSGLDTVPIVDDLSQVEEIHSQAVEYLATISGLRKLCIRWNMYYKQVRRWIIVVGDDEEFPETKIAGVVFMKLSQALEFVNTPLPANEGWDSDTSEALESGQE